MYKNTSKAIFIGLMILPISIAVTARLHAFELKSKRDYSYQTLSKGIFEEKILPASTFKLLDSDDVTPIDYEKFGRFKNAGLANYEYILNDIDGLKRVTPSGIYPNENGLMADSDYLKFKKENDIHGSHWDYLNYPNDQWSYYIWTQASEDPGVKAFFTARILERSGHIIPAIKAYYATLVFFPKSFCWAEDKSFVWYIAPTALADLRRLLRDYPQLGLYIKGASTSVLNGNDLNFDNDIIRVNPGQLIKAEPYSQLKGVDLSELKVIKTIGTGEVKLLKYQNGHWQMTVHNKPYFIHGITYNPTIIGIGPHTTKHFLNKWMFRDENDNNTIDGPYEAWVDKNNNDQQDAGEKAVGDFQLMHDIGINTIRLYVSIKDNEYNPALINKPLLRDLYKTYGIRVIIGNFLGAYTEGSGASWEAGTDYSNPQQQALMKKITKDMVMDLKDEPFVLLWLLGNENNMPGDYTGVNATRTNAASSPRAYAQFVNEIAEMIHQIDPNHPVAIGNYGNHHFEIYDQYAPAIDILGVNAYFGKNGFQDLWNDAKSKFDRPVFISEYGCDAYFENKGEDELQQLEYHKGNYKDLIYNMAGGPYTGNAIGGAIFEYLDEWWKDTTGNPENEHQEMSQYNMPFADNRSHEEWYGIISQGSGKNSPFQRNLREAYQYYKTVFEKQY